MRDWTSLVALKSFLVSGVLALGACALPPPPDVDHDARPGSGDGGTDGPAMAQQILVDGNPTTQLTVEEGGSATVEVTLREAPVGSLAVVVAADDAEIASVAPTALTFDAANFDVPQTITISGAQDDDDVTETSGVALTASGAEAAAIELTVNDDEHQAVLVSAATVALAEGASEQVGVTLRFPPAADVTVAVSSDDELTATVVPAELVFTPANWDQAQDVTVVAQDDVNTTVDTATISMAAAGANTAMVQVDVSDDDSVAFVLGASSLTVNENGTGARTFTVRLSHQPTETVMATAAPMTAGIYTLEPSALTFNSVNWADPQTVTVTAVTDSDDVDESTPARITAGGLPTATVSVTIEDTTQIVYQGWPTSFGNFNTYGNGILHAYRFTVSGTTPVTLDRWGLITTSVGSVMVNMGLYTNGASGPGTLITSSGAFLASAGELDVPDTTTLSPGTYWLTLNASQTISITESAQNADAYCNRNITWGSALPTTWGSPVCFPQYQTNVYLVTYR